MPKQIQHRRITQKIRQGVIARDNAKKPRCKASDGTKPCVDKIIGDSIHSLTLKSIVGLERFIKIEGNSKVDWQGDYVKMCNELLACCYNAIKILKGEIHSFNPIDAGLSIETAFTYVINLFESDVLPAGFDYNIDECDDTKEFHFTVYKEQIPFGEWICFEIKPIILQINTDTVLYDIFIRFLYNFSNKTEIGFWWQNSMENVTWWLQEQINEILEPDAFESENEYYKRKYELQKIVEEYSGTGEQYRIMQEITNCMFYSPDDLTEELDDYLKSSSCRKNQRIAIWIKSACQFMKLNGCLTDFVYDKNYYDDEGIQLADQYAIIWDAKDEYTNHQEMYLNDLANGCGIVSPCINYPIKKDIKNIDWIEFKERSNWLDKLYELWQQFDELNQSLKTKKINGKK